VNQDDIMAVVVSFNGGYKTLDTINALLEQVGHIHVVDNASDPESASILERVAERPGVDITRLSENRGVGFALNIGVGIARECGYSWLLTMDQDSIADPGMVQAFVTAVDANPSMHCLASLYSVKDSGSDEAVRKVGYAITSGNLVRMDVYDKVGLYDESLFVDGVDFDFSLRVRSSGMRIYQVTAARMQHALGDRVCNVPVLGRFHTYHTPVRRYYMYRNHLYLLERYALRFPGFAVRSTVAHVVYLFTTLLLGEQRLRSLRYICRGVVHYIRDISGPFTQDRVCGDISG